jgi:hypothetical protein
VARGSEEKSVWLQPKKEEGEKRKEKVKGLSDSEKTPLMLKNQPVDLNYLTALRAPLFPVLITERLHKRLPRLTSDS